MKWKDFLKDKTNKTNKAYSKKKKKDTNLKRILLNELNS